MIKHTTALKVPSINVPNISTLEHVGILTISKKLPPLSFKVTLNKLFRSAHKQHLSPKENIYNVKHITCLKNICTKMQINNYKSYEYSMRKLAKQLHIDVRNFSKIKKTKSARRHSKPNF